jgi:nucleoside-diphosphate-sugar epimerase
MNPNSKIYIPGHRGLVGAAIVRKLKDAGYSNLLLRTHAELDLTDTGSVDALFKAEKPDYVFLAAAFGRGRCRAGAACRPQPRLPYMHTIRCVE